MDSFEKIKSALKQKKSFILEAGAGSGKTYTLIQTVNHIIDNESKSLIKRGQKIACITFTNVAKDQIIERTGGNPIVQAQTIHEFLWECIANYQLQLHPKIEELNKLYSQEKRNYEYIEDLETIVRNLNITYWDYGRKFIEGKITHEDVLVLSNFMFRDFKKLSNILSDKYPYLFVDEYQDTELITIELLLEYHLLRNSSEVILGFFGDSMQKIYNKGVGRIPDKYIENGTLTFITKNENYRSSISVVELLNHIRPELIQTPEKKNEGKVSFIYGVDDFERVNDYIKTYDLLKTENQKTLFLTHRNISKKGKYENLFSIYSNRYGQFATQRLIDKEDRYSDFFMGEKGVENLVKLYELKKYNDFISLLGKVGFKLQYHSDKTKLRQEIDELNVIRNSKSVKELFDYIKKKELLTIPEKIKDFESSFNGEIKPQDENYKDYDFYENLMYLPYIEWISLYDYVEQNTAFSTMHNTKGDEYNNVMVVIDDAAWRQQYSFDKMISKSDTSVGRFERTLNLFYVCCSRAITNLVVVALTPINNITKQTAINWFKNENVHEIK